MPFVLEGRTLLVVDDALYLGLNRPRHPTDGMDIGPPPRGQEFHLMNVIDGLTRKYQYQMLQQMLVQLVALTVGQRFPEVNVSHAGTEYSPELLHRPFSHGCS